MSTPNSFVILGVAVMTVLNPQAVASLEALEVNVLKDAVVDDISQDIDGKRSYFAGKIVTSEEDTFAFSSYWRQSQELMSFGLQGDDPIVDYSCIGFKLTALKNEQTIIEIFGKDGSIEKMKMKPNEELKEEDKMILESCVSELGGVFVAASQMLGEQDGYIGSENHAVLAFHMFALWMSKLSGTVLEIEQDKFTSDTTNEVAMELGQCTTQSCCTNDCFGMCGYGCNCWSWICGHCGCVDECQHHDMYCSCESMYHYWCLNVFWVACNDQGATNWCPESDEEKFLRTE